MVWFVPLMGCLVLLYGFACVAAVYGTYMLHQLSTMKEARIESIEQRMEWLKQQRLPDPRVELFRRYKQSIVGFAVSRTDELAKADWIFTQLPASAALEQASMNEEDGSIEVEAVFSRLADAAEYVRRAEASGLFAEAAIDSLQEQPFSSEEAAPYHVVLRFISNSAQPERSGGS